MMKFLLHNTEPLLADVTVVGAADMFLSFVNFVLLLPLSAIALLANFKLYTWCLWIVAKAGTSVDASCAEVAAFPMVVRVNVDGVGTSDVIV